MKPIRWKWLLGFAITLLVFARLSLEEYSRASVIPVELRCPVNLSIHGIHLGMTRAEVTDLLGSPVRPAPPGLYRFPEFRYLSKDPDAEVRVKFSEKDIVIRVSGDSLDWPGGRLKSGSPASVIRQYFPPPLKVTAGHVGASTSGEWTYLMNDLQIQTRSGPTQRESQFYRAKLGVPFVYPFASYWRRIHPRANLLSTTGGEADIATRDSLQAFEVVGCFICVELFAPKALPKKGRAALCPSCKGRNLVGGSKQELTLEFLTRLRKLWMTPRGGRESMP